MNRVNTSRKKDIIQISAKGLINLFCFLPKQSKFYKMFFLKKQAATQEQTANRKQCKSFVKIRKFHPFAFCCVSQNIFQQFLLLFLVLRVCGKNVTQIREISSLQRKNYSAAPRKRNGANKNKR